MENIGDPGHPNFDRDLVRHLLDKLNALIDRELSEDNYPIGLDMFGPGKASTARKVAGCPRFIHNGGTPDERTHDG